MLIENHFKKTEVYTFLVQNNLVQKTSHILKIKLTLKKSKETAVLTKMVIDLLSR